MWWAQVCFFIQKGVMGMGRRLTALLAVLVMLLLAACQGKPLPGGMEETALLDAGQEALLLLAGGDYGGVYGLLREDVAEALTAEDIRDLALRQLDGAGVYKQIESRMATGQSSDGEDYGVAVFYCEYSKKDVLVRLAFDPDYALIGLEVKKQ